MTRLSGIFGQGVDKDKRSLEIFLSNGQLPCRLFDHGLIEFIEHWHPRVGHVLVTRMAASVLVGQNWNSESLANRLEEIALEKSRHQASVTYLRSIFCDITDKIIKKLSIGCLNDERFMETVKRLHKVVGEDTTRLQVFLSKLSPSCRLFDHGLIEFIENWYPRVGPEVLKRVAACARNRQEWNSESLAKELGDSADRKSVV